MLSGESSVFVYELSKVLAGSGQSVTMLSGVRSRDLVLGGVRLEHTPSCAGEGRSPRITSVNSGAWPCTGSARISCMPTTSGAAMPPHY